MTPAPGSALAVLATLPVKGKAPKTGYNRTADFGPAWLDVDRNGCDTRNDVLRRDVTDTTGTGCRVLTGTLHDRYTGTTINFVRGNTTSTAVQIDHVVPLANAWQTGAQSLTEQQRADLANDPINLFAAIDAYRDGQGNAIPDNRRFSEKISGARMDRAQLNALLDQARPGDRIVVSSLHRLGRTAVQTLQTIERLEQNNITVVSLRSGENFEGHTGALIRGIMALVAEWERINTAERAANARAAREARGVVQQRGKGVLKPDVVTDVQRLHARGATKVAIAKQLGLSRSSVYRALQDA